MWINPETGSVVDSPVKPSSDHPLRSSTWEPFPPSNSIDFNEPPRLTEQQQRAILKFLAYAVGLPIAAFLFLLLRSYLTIDQKGVWSLQFPAVRYVQNTAVYDALDLDVYWLLQRHKEGHPIDMPQDSIVKGGPLLGVQVSCRCENLTIEGSARWSEISASGTLNIGSVTDSAIGGNRVITHGDVERTREMGETITNLGTVGRGNDIIDGARHRAMKKASHGRPLPGLTQPAM